LQAADGTRSECRRRRRRTDDFGGTRSECRRRRRRTDDFGGTRCECHRRPLRKQTRFIIGNLSCHRLHMSCRVLLLDEYLRRHSNCICKLGYRYKTTTAVTKLWRPLQNYRHVTVKHNAEIPGDTKVLAFLDIVHTPAGLFTPNFGRFLDDCVFQGSQERYTQQMPLVRQWETTASVCFSRVGLSKTFSVKREW